MELKDIIRNRRIALGMTMKQVADAVGVNEATISRWESGEIDNMRRDRIAALAKILSIDPVLFLDDAVGKSEQPAYYTDPETAKIAQEIFDDSDLHALFKAARGSRPENIAMAAELLTRLKGTNPDG